MPVRKLRMLFVVGLTVGVVIISGGPVSILARQRGVQQVTVTFEALNGSGAKGTATLTARGDQTLVELDISGLTGHHPDHIHRSTCENPEPNPLYPLSDVVLNQANESGHSATLVDVPLAELLADPHVILIHKSHEEINVYVACADIVATETGNQTNENKPTGIPRTGVGATASDDRFRGANSAVLLLVLAAIASAIAGTRLNRSARP